jgi:hypothetical protein
MAVYVSFFIPSILSGKGRALLCVMLIKQYYIKIFPQAYITLFRW